MDAREGIEVDLDVPVLDELSDEDNLLDPHPARTEVKRSLQTRHLSMIALGGSIGTGLFLACGQAISGGGPGSAIIAYLAIGTMIYFMMSGVGELATFLPIPGSFSAYSERFFDPALGFASGWCEMAARSITLTIETLTCGILIKFWLPNFPSWPWELGIFLFIFLVNAFTVRSFAEIEFWMALVKIITVIVFIIVGLLRMFGAIGEATYFRNWVHGDAPFVHGFAGFLGAVVIAGFSFMGSELVGITAAESRNPGRDIPIAIRQVVWRILFFYVLSIFCISCLVPYDDSSLLGADTSDTTKSPFTLVLSKAGIPAAAHIMNAIVLSSVISSGNAMVYTASRMLYALSSTGKAPAIFSHTFKSGIPFWSLLATATIALVVYAMSKIDNQLYTTLIAAISVAGFINWFVIALTHFRFRRAYVAQGFRVRELAYFARLFPVGPIVVMVISFFMAVCHNLDSFKKGEWGHVAITYISVILVLLLYGAYKLWKKTKIIPLMEINFRVGPLQAPLIEGSESGVEPPVESI
jgi:lysine-specific permease